MSHALAISISEHRQEVLAERQIHAVAKHSLMVAHRTAMHQAAVAQHNLAVLSSHRAHATLSPVNITPISLVGGSPPTTAYTPSQVKTAYGVNLLPLANQGQGVTIAIVDVFSDPTIVADAKNFSTQFGLPQLDGVGGDPTFTIVAQPNTPQSPLNGEQPGHDDGDRPRRRVGPFHRPAREHPPGLRE